MSDSWYYARGTAQSGPMTIEELRERLRADGNVSEALVWRDGFSGWQRASEITELMRSGPPPLPVRSENSILREPSDSEGSKKESGWKKASGWGASLVGGLIGLTLAKTLGAVFWFPAIGIGGSWLILNKAKVEPWLIPAVAIILGHAFWVVLGMLIIAAIGKATFDIWFNGISEFIAVGLLVFWILKRGSRLSLTAYVLLEVMGIVTVLTADEAQKRVMAAAFVVHLVLRVAGIVAAGYALYKQSVATKTLLAG